MKKRFVMLRTNGVVDTVHNNGDGTFTTSDLDVITPEEGCFIPVPKASQCNMFHHFDRDAFEMLANNLVIDRLSDRMFYRIFDKYPGLRGLRDGVWTKVSKVNRHYQHLSQPPYALTAGFYDPQEHHWVGPNNPVPSCMPQATDVYRGPAMNG